MSRILRNYLISFVIIGLIFLAVHLINRMVEERMQGPIPPQDTAPRQGDAASRQDAAPGQDSKENRAGKAQ